jgi:hypothetical protein
MNALVLTVLALGGADASLAFAGSLGGGSGGYAAGAGGYQEACNECNEGSGHHRNQHAGVKGWLGPMPQSCYNPSFGCYSNSRYMHRYPAFHNYYYRAAYNYRHDFDYPWHAGLHEPTSMFSYHVPGENPAQAVPTPMPSAARAPGSVKLR